MALIEGKKAPAFTAVDQDGQKIKLADFKGKKLALYFYPKDATSTCTVQACNLRDGFKELSKKGIEVVGVSPDDEKSHLKFIAKQALPFRLIVAARTAAGRPSTSFRRKYLQENNVRAILEVIARLSLSHSRHLNRVT